LGRALAVQCGGQRLALLRRDVHGGQVRELRRQELRHALVAHVPVTAGGHELRQAAGGIAQVEHGLLALAADGPALCLSGGLALGWGGAVLGLWL
jgi:hypothetical protein